MIVTTTSAHPRREVEARFTLPPLVKGIAATGAVAQLATRNLRVAAYVQAQADEAAWYRTVAEESTTTTKPPTTTTTVPVPTTVPVTTPPTVPTTQPSSGGPGDPWWRVAICEEGGRNDPTFGFFGILPSTWQGMGMSGTAGQYSYGGQEAVAYRITGGSVPDANGCASW